MCVLHVSYSYMWLYMADFDIDTLDHIQFSYDPGLDNKSIEREKS